MAITIRNEIVELFDGNESVSIMHLSDMHVWFSSTMLEELATIVDANPPHMILMTGDYFDLAIGARLVCSFLKRIDNKVPILFIKGNHEKFFGNKTRDLFLENSNCHEVEDKIYKYQTKNGNVIQITSWSNRDALTAESQSRNILLIHNPERLKAEGVSNAHLILAGHLHGGQFIFYKTSKGHNWPGSLIYKYCVDRTKIGSTELIVSKGLGDTFPFRFNCPKEVVKIDLV